MESLILSLGRLEVGSWANKMWPCEAAVWEWLWRGHTAATKLQHHPVYVKFMPVIDRNQCWIQKWLLQETVFLFFLLKGSILWNYLLYKGCNSASSEKKWPMNVCQGQRLQDEKLGRKKTWGCHEEKGKLWEKLKCWGNSGENGWWAETGEVGGTGFRGDRGQLPLTVYQDLGETHLSCTCEPGVLLQDLTLGLLP